VVGCAVWSMYTGRGYSRMTEIRHAIPEADVELSTAVDASVVTHAPRRSHERGIGDIIMHEPLEVVRSSAAMAATTTGDHKRHHAAAAVVAASTSAASYRAPTSSTLSPSGLGFYDRVVFVASCFVAIIICYADRANISTAIIAMREEYGWDEEVEVRHRCSCCSCCRSRHRSALLGIACQPSLDLAIDQMSVFDS